MPLDVTKPADNVNAVKADVRNNWIVLDNQVGALPEDYSGKTAGALVAVTTDSDGITTVDLLDEDTALSAEGRALRRVKPHLVEVTGSISLTDDDHCGALLYCTNASAITITVDEDDPDVGVSHGFSCTIIRRVSAGTVSVSSTGLANTHPSGHNDVVAGSGAVLFVDTANAEFVFSGGTSA